MWVIEFIDAHRHRFGVEPICRVLREHGLPIAPSSCYAQHHHQPCGRALRDGELVELMVRLRDENGTRPLATLNGTLCAMTRMIVLLLENHQQPDGSVRIPAALRPYLAGKESLTPVVAR